MAETLFELVGRIAVEGYDQAAGQIDDAEAAGSSLAETIEGAGDRMSDFGDRVSSAGSTLSRTLTPAIAGAAGALGAFAVSKARAADEIAKNARQAGVGAQAYQSLGFALGQVTNLNDREVERSFSRLNQTIAEGVRGQDRAVESLAALGFSQEEIAEGSIDTEDAMRRAFEQIRNVDTQAEATGLAMELFGRRVGRELAPQIRESGDELERWEQKAEETGGLISDKLLDAAERFNDMLSEQALRLQGVGNAAAESLLPALEDLIPALVDSLVPVLERGVAVLTTMVNAFAALPQPVQTTVVAALALAAALGPVLFIAGKLIGVVGGVVSSIGRLMVAVKAAGGIIAAFKGVALVPFLPLLAKVAVAVAAVWVAFRVGKAAIEGIGALIDWLGERIGDFMPSLDDIRDAFAGAWDAVSASTSAFVSRLVDRTVGRLRSLAQSISGILSNIRQGFASAFQSIYDATIGRVRAMVDDVVGLASSMWQSLTGNSIIPRMADEAIDEFARMAEGAEDGSEAMRRGMEGAISEADMGQAGGTALAQGQGGGSNYIDMSHSTFRDDRDMLDRIRRNGTDLTGAFS